MSFVMMMIVVAVCPGIVATLPAAAPAPSSPNVPAGATRPPNVVILFVDDMGIDQIQVPAAQRDYGYTGNKGTIKTPNIYRLAEEGMVFQTWYSGFHVCTPSRAAMMTGRLPVRSGIGAPNSMYAPDAPGPSQGGNLVFTGESVGGLPLNETTLAEALRPHGFTSLCVGKWHLGQRDIYLPVSRGFDHYLGIPFSQDIGTSFWRPTGGPPYVPTPLPLLHNLSVLEQPADLFNIATKYAAITTDFIANAAAAGKPFMVYLPFNHIHGPNSCGARWCGQSARGPVGDATEETDWIIGEVMAQLKTSGVDDNTLVFFTSDNGAPVHPDGNSPLRGYKGSIWEGGYREPGIARWPGKIKPGSRSDALVATYDIYPTVLALAGVPLPPVTLDGQDISPVLFGKSDKAHDCIMFYKYPHAATTSAINNLAAVRCGNHKVYWYVDSGPPGGVTPGAQPDGSPLVFDLTTDPSEDRPLNTSDPAYAAAVQAASTARAAHIASIQIVPNQNARGNNPAFAICADPDSKAKYPQFPNCTITPAGWTPPICGSPDTHWCNQTADGKCPASCGGKPSPGPPAPPAPPLPPAPPMPATDLVGCFVDHAPRCDLPHVIDGGCAGGAHVHSAYYDHMTPATCNTLCNRAGTFKFFGNQAGHACFCGNSYGSMGKGNTSDCDVPCTGDKSEICGGLNFNSVWKIRPALPWSH